ncbi:hypothetical protein CEXT_119581 [Caerostris extrusa]|uniref:Uncharacterized protein n=1 Tax=Caerostris extrusa TaxID=172846 RepID=A0AAV4VSP2_CAEEX|nr:hypothetical protein CEXT_119581 [Caerostris extrusa]
MRSERLNYLFRACWEMDAHVLMRATLSISFYRMNDMRHGDGFVEMSLVNWEEFLERHRSVVRVPERCGYRGSLTGSTIPIAYSLFMPSRYLAPQAMSHHQEKNRNGTALQKAGILNANLEERSLARTHHLIFRGTMRSGCLNYLFRAHVGKWMLTC